VGVDILYLLIPLSVVLVFIIGLLFGWALKRGQFEDLEGPGYRILMDDDGPPRSRVDISSTGDDGQSAET
jgi:cbb3-type cytochrome oxidase maturation protein